ncbi:MAG TPA: hypothetical protein VJ934_03770 [Desulfomicrobiaceae bacterium]|nr:hypothetical protein [Desulfomicrobiaceae bacterium]
MQNESEVGSLDQDVCVWELESEYFSEQVCRPDGVCETWEVDDSLSACSGFDDVTNEV